MAPDDLARKVRWVSEEDGDGAGYDIASFGPDGRARLIEVETTNGWPTENGGAKLVHGSGGIGLLRAE